MSNWRPASSSPSRAPREARPSPEWATGLWIRGSCARTGASSAFTPEPGLRAVYAVLGVVRDTDFEPYLLGIHRGISASSTRVAEGTGRGARHAPGRHLPAHRRWPDRAWRIVTALHQVYAWLDLGSEGLIPHPANWGTGSRLFSSVWGPGPRLTFPFFPRLEGSSFLFLNLLRGTTAYPQSLLYHRQPGSAGRRCGARSHAAAGHLRHSDAGTRFEGTLAGARRGVPRRRCSSSSSRSWGLREGRAGRWSCRAEPPQVSMPAPALDVLRATLPAGAVLRAELTTSRVPRFQYDHWTYDALSPWPGRPIPGPLGADRPVNRLGSLALLLLLAACSDTRTGVDCSEPLDCGAPAEAYRCDPERRVPCRTDAACPPNEQCNAAGFCQARAGLREERGL